ncbi:MAG: MarR family transcriptional regulator [Pseudomonadota bacterium]
MKTIHTHPDFSSLCACQALRRTARAVSRRYNQALKPADLNIGQFTTLAALLQSGPLSISALAEQLGMDRTTLTRDLKPLERRRLIRSEVDDDDARQRFITISDDGRSLMEQAVPLWEAAQEMTKKGMSANEWADFRSELKTLSE